MIIGSAGTASEGKRVKWDILLFAVARAAHLLMWRTLMRKDDVLQLRFDARMLEQDGGMVVRPGATKIGPLGVIHGGSLTHVAPRPDSGLCAATPYARLAHCARRRRRS